MLWKTTVIIQLEWIMEEYVKIFFKEVWLNPPHLPIKPLKIITINIE